MFIRLLLLKK